MNTFLVESFTRRSWAGRGLAGVLGCIALTGTLAVGGCSAGPRIDTASAVDAGPGPAVSQEDAEKLGWTWLTAHNVAFKKTQVRWSSVAPDEALDSAMNGGGVIRGYRLMAQVDCGRDAEGVEVTHDYKLMIRDGRVAAAWGHREVNAGCCSNPYMQRFD